MHHLEIQSRLRSQGSPEHAKAAAWFFKTGPGQYGVGDKFAGLRVPAVRKLAKEYCSLPLGETECLLRSEIHEERLLALFILVGQAVKGDDKHGKSIYELYLANTKWVNSWDLVDCSAPRVIGAYLENKSRKPLYRLAKSKSLWERRIGIVATFHFIRSSDFGDTLSLAEILIDDKEDLIHKAVGWMLREVGKREISVLEGFLRCHCMAMPRTMLRYAIEKFPEQKRKAYLKR